MSKITIANIAALSVPTPSSGQLTIFADATNSDHLSIKTSAGLVFDLLDGATTGLATVLAADNSAGSYKIDMNGNAIILSNISGDIQSIDGSTGDIIISSDAYAVWIQSDAGLRVDSRLTMTGSSGIVWSGAPTSSRLIGLGDPTNSIGWRSGFSIFGDLSAATLTASRTWALPDASGTVALTNDLDGYLPLAGATLPTDMIIDADSNVFILSNATHYSVSSGGDTNLTMNAGGIDLGFGFGLSLVQSGIGGSTLFNDPNGNGSLAFNTTVTQLTLFDGSLTASPGGLTIVPPTGTSLAYGADYSANYNNRSLVDKEYVTTTFAPIVLEAVITKTDTDLDDFLTTTVSTGGVEIVPAPGAGKMIRVLDFAISSTISSPFSLMSGGDTDTLGYFNFNLCVGPQQTIGYGLGTSLVAGISAVQSMQLGAVYSSSGVSFTTPDFDMENQPIRIIIYDHGDGDYPAPHNFVGTGSVKFTVRYEIVDI